MIFIFFVWLQVRANANPTLLNLGPPRACPLFLRLALGQINLGTEASIKALNGSRLGEWILANPGKNQKTHVEQHLKDLRFLRSVADLPLGTQPSNVSTETYLKNARATSKIFSATLAKLLNEKKPKRSLTLNEWSDEMRTLHAFLTGKFGPGGAYTKDRYTSTNAYPGVFRDDIAAMGVDDRFQFGIPEFLRFPEDYLKHLRAWLTAKGLGATHLGATLELHEDSIVHYYPVMPTELATQFRSHMTDFFNQAVTELSLFLQSESKNELELKKLFKTLARYLYGLSYLRHSLHLIPDT